MTDSLLAQILAALDIFVSERVAPSSFRSLVPVPDFCLKLGWTVDSAEGAVLDFGPSPFIMNFLEDAEQAWKDSSALPLKSGPWVESDITDTEFPMEASALAIGDSKVLVIELLGIDLSQRRELLQRAREKLLLERRLTELVKQRTRQILLTQEATIESLASLGEVRDYETGGHIRRTQRYVRLLSLYLKKHARFNSFLDDETIELLYKSAPLHDIGKVGLPDRILLKPGRLTHEEFQEAKEHTRLGREALQAAEKLLGSNSFLRLAAEIAYTHHEKWDGSGYPEGLAGDAIPISGRLMALADVYDALISKRVYKPAIPHSRAVEMIAEGKGAHFDPDVVEAFLAMADEFEKVSLEYADSLSQGEEPSRIHKQDSPANDPGSRVQPKT